jgi:hypothetical protein
MELRARIRHFARPAAFGAALTALLVPAAPAAASTKKYPVVTSVRPMNPKVGDTLVIRGRNFNRGKNTVVFKRDGSRAVFAKSTLATARQIRVIVPDTLRAYLPDNTTARFRLRILAQRFSKKFTSNSASPSVTALPKPTGGGTTVHGGTIVTPSAPGTPTIPGKVCTGDEDGDMLDASLENTLGLDPCNADSDDDGVSDGYEYKSAQDLNDDEYQQVNQNLPFPGKRPYPNPLFKDDNTDYDGDGLPLGAEYRLWDRYGARPAGGLIGPGYQLLYSDGEQYSLSTRDVNGHRVPTQPAATYTKANDFLNWAGSNGYNPVLINKNGPHWYDARQPYDIRDTNLDGTLQPSEVSLADLDGDTYISDDERDEDADGLSNIDELRSAMTSGYWVECYKETKETPYPITYAGTDLTDADTDGDGVRDGADDQDHDDIPNVMELSRYAASGGFVDWHARKGMCHVAEGLMNGPDLDGDGAPDPVVRHLDSDYGRVQPFNPCLPFKFARACPSGVTFGETFAPYDNSPWYSLQ